MAQRESIFVNIIHYASSSLFQKVLRVITALIRPKLLSPELFGLWNVLSILPTYASYLHLGSRSSMRFLIPYQESRGEDEAISSTKSAVYHGTFYPTLFVAVVLILLAVFVNMALEARLGLVAVAVVILFNWKLDYAVGVLKSHQHFRLISKYNYVTAVAHFVLTVALIFLFGFYGALLSAVFTAIVGLVYLKAYRSYQGNGRFRFGIFLDLVKQGFPVMALNLISELIRTSDRFVLFFTLGQETVGYYGIAIIMLGFSISIPAISREVVEPRLMENLDRATVAENLELFMTRPLMNTAYLMPFVVGPGILLLPVAIPPLLPDYTPGILPAQILLLGAYFLAAAHVLRGVIVAFGLQLKASLVALVVLLVNILLSLTMVFLGYDAEGVALASSASFLMLFASLFILIWWQIRAREHGLTARILWFLVPFPVMCIMLLIPDRLFMATEQSLIYPIIFKMCLFLSVQVALLYMVRSRGLVSFRIDSQ